MRGGVQIDDYERLVVDGLARGEVELAIGDGRSVLLGHEAGEGTLEVFRLGERDLLAVIASCADEPGRRRRAGRAPSKRGLCRRQASMRGASGTARQAGVRMRAEAERQPVATSGLNPDVAP
jgi:hypothetical protein